MSQIEEVKKIIRQFYWFAREHPKRKETLNLEKLIGDVAQEICQLSQERVEQIVRHLNLLLKHNPLKGTSLRRELGKYAQALKEKEEHSEVKLDNLPNSIYKEAWRTLAMCLGERMQGEKLELMDSVLSGVKLDFEERQDAIQNKTTE